MPTEYRSLTPLRSSSGNYLEIRIKNPSRRALHRQINIHTRKAFANPKKMSKLSSKAPLMATHGMGAVLTRIGGT